MSSARFIPAKEFRRLSRAKGRPFLKTALFADMCRQNALSMIMTAGSGHIGSSFSSLDIMSWLYQNELQLPKDIFFSSKGHDAPAFYSVLIGSGLLEEKYLASLRRLGGLPGHPDIRTPHVEANTGSLGMGLSKAKGMVDAARLEGKKRRIFVLTGDGEWQEGQLWESLASAAKSRMSEITLIVDANKIQSDTWVEKVSSLGDLSKKAAAFGWRVYRCNGHNLKALAKTFAQSRKETSKPKLIIADTIKGKGVSFMQWDNPKKGGRLYGFHSGAPTFEIYKKACEELDGRIRRNCRLLRIASIEYALQTIPEKKPLLRPQRLIEAYSQILEEWGARHKKLVVLDADLAKDCGLLAFEKKYPKRFTECGIAEQDMVSRAGGLALRGFLPVVHSFASFLTARANEQISVNASEGKKIIYAGALAGLLPSAPGHSHQSVKDIAALCAMPGIRLIQPSSSAMLKEAFAWAVEKAQGSVYLRLSNVPWDLSFEVPQKPFPEEGQGRLLRVGTDAVLFGYGPVLLSEACLASDLLKRGSGFTVAVMDSPWLNTVDPVWLGAALKKYTAVFTLDDHAIIGGQGQMIAAAIARMGLSKPVYSLGVDGLPLCGENREVLKAHHLDAASLAHTIASRLKSASVHAAY